MNADWTAPEQQLSAGLTEAESEAVVSLLAEAKTTGQLLAVAENAAGFAEAMWKKHLHPQSPPVACKEGCSWCCYQLVPVSVPEVVRIINFVNNSLQEAERKALVERLRSLDRGTRGLTSQQRVGIPKPCPYLQEGRCSIYPVRPLACAEFTSYDVQTCKRGKRIGFKPGAVIHEKARMVAYISVQRGISQGLSQALPTHDTRELELVAASVLALEDENAVSAWLQGSSVFRTARLNRPR